jgi:hypothetical protein
MKVNLRRLILGNPKADSQPTEGSLHKRVRNIRSIWYNEQDEDVGIEKLFRLFLAVSQFLFPGTYIKEWSGRYGVAVRELSVDVFILCKVLFPFLIVYFGWQHNNIAFYTMIWFLLETLLYVPTLIFASDYFTRPRSYRRSMLLLFFNYIEIAFSFGVIYSRGQYFNRPFTHWFDPIYFSFVTLSTVGYGEYFPVVMTGKVLICIESTIFVTFVVLFLNFFSTKVEHRGYFDHTKK